MAEPDYAALAQRFGGDSEINVTIRGGANDPPPARDVEFELLAQKFGGKPEDVSRVGQSLPSPSGADLPRGDQPDDTGIYALLSHAAKQLNVPAGMIGMGKALIPETAARAMGVGGQEAQTYGPLNTLRAVGTAQEVPFRKAQQSYAAGDYGTAARHFVDYLIPMMGPVLDAAADRSQAGHVMAGAGDAIGLALSLFAPHALGRALTPGPTLTRPEAPSIVDFANQRGVPLDAATATDNPAVRGVQWLADRSLAGSVVGGKAKAAQGQALQRVGADLAQDIMPSALTPEQAGTNTAAALQARSGALERTADHAYDLVRTLEAKPENKMMVPTGASAPVDQVVPSQVGQLRRMVHELDAMPFTKRLLQPTEKGGGLEPVPGTGGAGAAVFDDIVGRLSAGSPTRGAVQAQIEAYLGGGRETPVVKAALEVASARAKGQGGRGVALPELPASAMDIPTAAERARVTSTEMALPVNLAEVKRVLRPLADQMHRQLPLTQQQANPGLHAINQILQGPDWAPLSQTDRDLGAIKELARNKGGLAKIAVQKLGAAVSEAASNGGPDVTRALTEGRSATVAKYSAQGVADLLRREPVQTFKAMTAPKDAGIALLRAVTRETPEVAPQIARGLLDDLLHTATADGGFDHAAKVAADWSKIGSETRRILFPKPGQAQALDQFFQLARKMAENPNPSGSGYSVAQAGQLAAFYANPVAALSAQLGGLGLSTFLHSPLGVRLLTRSLQLKAARAPLAAQAATAAQVIRAAHEMSLGATPAVATTQSPAPAAGAPAGQ